MRNPCPLQLGKGPTPEKKMQKRAWLQPKVPWGKPSQRGQEGTPRPNIPPLRRRRAWPSWMVPIPLTVSSGTAPALTSSILPQSWATPATALGTVLEWLVPHNQGMYPRSHLPPQRETLVCSRRPNTIKSHCRLLSVSLEEDCYCHFHLWCRWGRVPPKIHSMSLSKALSVSSFSPLWCFKERH